MRRLIFAASVWAALTAGPHAAAQLTQPDGTVVPVGDNLGTLLNTNGETIVPSTDAATTPETFRPDCELTFTVLGRGAGQRNSFGWYNVTGTKPQLSELYEFITCNDGVGAVKVLDIRADARYLGGEIGFFEATTEGHTGFLQPNCVDFNDLPGTLGYVFYSEARYNDDNNASGPSFIHLLIMDSKVLPNTFYFGWEDLFQGGDNDFEDLLTRVEGIQCTGGGAPCDTGQAGICATGVTSCVNGALECAPKQAPGVEACNAVDDDCNGLVDDGDLCEAGEICDRGTCIGRCGTGEFRCNTDSTCRDGYCVERACAEVTCAEGQVCVLGICHGACDDVICPQGQECRTGACTSPCESVTCSPGEVCSNGVCVPCACGGCPGGTVCNGAATACVLPECRDVPCGSGGSCRAGGICVDDCEGAVCPVGQLCEGGRCVTDVNAPNGAGGAGQEPPVFAISGAPSQDPPAGGSATTDAGVEPPSAAPLAPVGTSGPRCGCFIPRRSDESGFVALLAAAGVLGRRRFAVRRGATTTSGFAR
jgi:hypothetical protein